METIHVLGQLMPAAATLLPLYTVPTGKSAVISTITVCNQGTATTFRLAVAPGGAADATAQYICRDVPLAANEPYPVTIGITLAAGDIVRVSSVSGNVSFGAYGSEIS